MNQRFYELTEQESFALSALTLTTVRKQDELNNLLCADNSKVYSILELEQEISNLRMPLSSKGFKSEFLDDVLLPRLDTFNPLNYIDNKLKTVKLRDYLFMVDLNVRVLQNLEGTLSRVGSVY